MTCIVAISDGQTVLLGGDSAGVGGRELRLRADSKVFRRGSYVIGFTTSFRMGQILRYETELPEPPPGLGVEELERFVVTHFVPAVRQSFEDHGFGKTIRFTLPDSPSVTEEGQVFGGRFLIGVAGRIFEIRRDYQVARPADPWAAIGTGAAPALGALCALEDAPGLTLRERAEKALRAAETYTVVVRRPFHFVD